LRVDALRLVYAEKTGREGMKDLETGRDKRETTSMHLFNVGAIRVHHVEEWQGPFAAPEELFADFDGDRFAAFRDELPGDMYLRDSNSVYAFLQSWILESDDLTVLYDTGAGNGKERPGIPVFGNLETAFLENLAVAGFEPGDIDVVINSHLHIDHVGWNTRRKGTGWEPTFPHARHLFSRIEHDYWHPRGDGPRPSAQGAEVNRNVFEDSVQPVLEAGLAELVEDGHQVAAGMTLRVRPGHTPGHLVLEVENGGERALFVGDILHHPAQVYCPEWNSVYCEHGEDARSTRKQILAQAADSGARVVPAHFGGCHYAWIERLGEGFRPRYRDD
jgi:glyoxylase-like metal-dependent hydrolase (beta-lactamase superfamily II)